MNMLLIVGLAIVGGIAVTLQGQFMGLMEQALGTLPSVFITYVSGGLVIVIIALIRGVSLGNLRQVPWYAFGAGLLGLVIVGTIGFVVPRLGVAGGFVLIVATQFVLAALIDHFGWFSAMVRPIDFPRFLGLVIMMVGVWLTIR